MTVAMSPKQAVDRAAFKFAVLAFAMIPVQAFGKNCAADGGLTYLGVTSNQTRSVWLSSTSPGSFILQATAGSLTVDQWTPGSRGLHVSLSPVVSNGNGGTHKLLDSGGCQLDTQNQKGGITFPSHISLPPVLPPLFRPPLTGLTPGMPGGVMPPIGTLPPMTGITPGMPGGITPPIGTLPPPTGITPGMPGGVTPPIAVIPPPTGITPGMPGGVTPPIGTLPPPTGITPGMPGGVTPPIAVIPPPTGITPGMPGGVTPPIAVIPPPTGITPGMPGGVTPPIAVIPPPTGITPGMPGGVTPPIGTLPPPTGITPGMPGGVTPPIAVIPPSTGITPGMPGGVTPPIGTLPPPTGITPGMPGGVTPPIAVIPPPTGITPGMPGGVTPPIGTLPPPTGITPGMPGGVTPPIAVIPPPAEVTKTVDGLAPARGSAPVTCPDGVSDNGQLIDCVDRRAVASGEFGGAAPITPGREFAEPSLWNVWADARHTGSTDHRYGLDTKGRGNYMTLGADRRIDNDFVAGISLSLEDNNSTGFGGASLVDSNGFNLAPYIGLRLSPEWSMDASVGVGMLSNDNRIDVLNGHYKAQRYSTAVNLTGHYTNGEVQLRPKLSLSFVHLRNQAYSMNGVVAGTPVTLNVAEDKFNYGVSEAVVEINKVVQMSGGKIVVPYAELGTRYEFSRPNGGQMLAFDLSLVTPSAWSGTLRLGARALVTRATFFEASLGYLSIGQKGLDVMEARLFLSHAW